MRRRRKTRNQLAVSLFPFLAVLICTLGVLIIMLVMAVKSAGDQAAETQAEQDNQQQSKIDQLALARDIQSVQLESLNDTRPETLARLNQSRANRAHLHDEIRKLKLQAKQLGEELRELSQQPENPTVVAESFSESDATIKLAALESEIEQAQNELDEKRDSVGQVEPASYVIVPHKGSGGTFRRPIFIECTADAITLQPLGIKLSKQEFTPPVIAGNALDAALLTIREYWQRYDLAGDQGSPYPLLIVRPDGAETFIVARHAMKSWDDEFGYELVESDKQLEFGKPDPQLAAEVNDAVKEARRRQRIRTARLVSARQQQRRLRQQAVGPQSVPGGLVASKSGGFVSQRGNSRSARNARHTDAQHRAGNGSTNDPSQSNQPTQNLAANNPKRAQKPGDNGQPGAQPRTSQNKGDGGSSAFSSLNADISVAKKRGANWALPSRTPGATGYLRPIRIHCGNEFIEIQNVRGAPQRIAITGQTIEAVDLLVDAVWQKIESWGVSGANSYWKPELRFTILPGGESRFHELRRLLDRSGLVVQEVTR